MFDFKHGPILVRCHAEGPKGVIFWYWWVVDSHDYESEEVDQNLVIDQDYYVIPRSIIPTWLKISASDQIIKFCLNCLLPCFA